MGFPQQRRSVGSLRGSLRCAAAGAKAFPPLCNRLPPPPSCLLPPLLISGRSTSRACAGDLAALRDDDDWSTDSDALTRMQLERQEASKLLTKGQLESIAAAQGYGRLFSEFGSMLEGLRACAAGEWPPFPLAACEWRFTSNPVAGASRHCAMHATTPHPCASALSIHAPPCSCLPHAVDALVDASAVDTLLSNFIIPLQSPDISKPDASGTWRVHCSLNINTETGRLSARRPNLQNQPALEKDRYKVDGSA
jgi:hypothetical protein